jgi:hypothetical protein
LKGSVGRSTNPDLLENDKKEAMYTILEFSNQNPAKKIPNTQKIEFWQAPNA